MSKITKRDLFAFLLGMLAFFIIESVYDWEATKKAFREGFDRGAREAGK